MITAFASLDSQQRQGASNCSDKRSLPLRAGVGLKPEHFSQIIETWPDLGFFEIHAENYMVDGGPFHHYLTRIRENYPLSIHGVGLSIGSESPLDPTHLDRLANLIKRYEPQSFSEHLAWSSHEKIFTNDLLPLPYDTKTLLRVCNHIEQIQEKLKCKMLLENPATYVEFSTSTMLETEFINEVIRRTGCGLLLDVNNVYVSCINHHRDPETTISALPLEAVREIHLAGFAIEKDSDGSRFLIDTHGAAIAQEVWDLYDYTLSRVGPIATLIERDNNIPFFDELLVEAYRADHFIHTHMHQRDIT